MDMEKKKNEQKNKNVNQNINHEIKHEQPKENPEIIKLKTENAALQDRVLRVTAEMQNMRRRMEEERANLLKYEDLIKKLLPIVDNFERAISMDDTNLQDEVSKFLSGFKMIYGNLNDTLKGFQVISIDVLNQPFNPEMMEAVLVEEVPGVESNIVVDVLQKGYTYKGKVIRHAMVKVSK